MRILLSAVLAAALFIVTGCGGGSPLTLTQENYNKVHEDMSQAEVKAILGAPTTSTSEPIPIVGGTQTTYIYSSDTASITIVFKNDKVKEKSSEFQKKELHIGK